jgi:hypothetical protein
MPVSDVLRGFINESANFVQGQRQQQRDREDQDMQTQMQILKSVAEDPNVTPEAKASAWHSFMTVQSAKANPAQKGRSFLGKAPAGAVPDEVTELFKHPVLNPMPDSGGGMGQPGGGQPAPSGGAPPQLGPQPGKVAGGPPSGGIAPPPAAPGSTSPIATPPTAGMGAVSPGLAQATAGAAGQPPVKPAPSQGRQPTVQPQGAAVPPAPATGGQPTWGIYKSKSQQAQEAGTATGINLSAEMEASAAGLVKQGWDPESARRAVAMKYGLMPKPSTPITLEMKDGSQVPAHEIGMNNFVGLDGSPIDGSQIANVRRLATQAPVLQQKMAQDVEAYAAANGLDLSNPAQNAQAHQAILMRHDQESRGKVASLLQGTQNKALQAQILSGQALSPGAIGQIISAARQADPTRSAADDVDLFQTLGRAGGARAASPTAVAPTGGIPPAPGAGGPKPSAPKSVPSPVAKQAQTQAASDWVKLNATVSGKQDKLTDAGKQTLMSVGVVDALGSKLLNILDTARDENGQPLKNSNQPITPRIQQLLYDAGIHIGNPNDPDDIDSRLMQLSGAGEAYGLRGLMAGRINQRMMDIIQQHLYRPGITPAQMYALASELKTDIIPEVRRAVGKNSGMDPRIFQKVYGIDLGSGQQNGAGGTVMMQSPDGKETKAVPASEVDRLLKAGAKRVP